MYLCILYGIVIIEIYSCNKWLYTLVVHLSLLYHLSVQRLGNPKMSIVYCGAPLYTQPYTPRQPYVLPIYLALPYITWVRGMWRFIKFWEIHSHEFKCFSDISRVPYTCRETKVGWERLGSIALDSISILCVLLLPSSRKDLGFNEDHLYLQ